MIDTPLCAVFDVGLTIEEQNCPALDLALSHNKRNQLSD
jgi:hypothetical protein